MPGPPGAATFFAGGGLGTGKVAARSSVPGRMDRPAMWSAKENPLTVMSRAPTLRREIVTLRTRPFSPARFAVNVVLTTGPTVAPARAPHAPVPNALVRLAPTTEPRTARNNPRS